MSCYFITGTDTDCGKTYVTEQLLKFFPESAALKPVASGCEYINGELVSEDALRLQKNNLLHEVQTINPWSFTSPVSPHLAVELDNKPLLKVDEIVSYCQNYYKYSTAKRVFIEGAGGLLVPLNSHETWIEVLKKLNIPVILVVGMKLGCINHALMSELTLHVNKIHCIGWIANCVDSDMLARDQNINTLTSKLKSPLLSIIYHKENMTFCNGLDG